MRKWIAFSLVLCLLFSLSACSGYRVNEDGLPVISNSLRNKLNKALKEQLRGVRFTEEYLEIWGSEEEYKAYKEGHIYPSIRYFGNHEGCDIIFYFIHTDMTDPDSVWLVKIGDYTFEASHPFNILGYKDGILYDLEELYKNGEISEESAAKIYQYYETFNEVLRSRAD